MPPETVDSTCTTADAATAATKEDEDSRAGSMTLLLPQLTTTGKQTEAGLTMPPLPPLQRPRKRLLVKETPSTCSGTTWVLVLLAAAAIMAAVAAAAMAMAARAEISRLRADVDRLRGRMGSHEALPNYIQRFLESGMAPAPDDEEVVWDEPQGPTPEDLSPSYPEANEFEFPADIKGNIGRHSRRHIPTVGGSYVSSQYGYRPGKSEKRLKLYDALATGTFPPEPAMPAMPAVPAVPTVHDSPSGEASARPDPYHHRSSSGRLIAQSQLALTAPADKVIVARRQEDK